MAAGFTTCSSTSTYDMGNSPPRATTLRLLSWGLRNDRYVDVKWIHTHHRQGAAQPGFSRQLTSTRCSSREESKLSSTEDEHWMLPEESSAKEKMPANYRSGSPRCKTIHTDHPLPPSSPTPSPSLCLFHIIFICKYYLYIDRYTSRGKNLSWHL